VAIISQNFMLIIFYQWNYQIFRTNKKKTKLINMSSFFHLTIYFFNWIVIACIKRDLRVFLLEKIQIFLSNYHSIINVPPKLPIVSMSPFKLPKNVNVPYKTNKKTKMTLINSKNKKTKTKKIKNYWKKN
jgi:hypothetical protein